MFVSRHRKNIILSPTNNGPLRHKSHGRYRSIPNCAVATHLDIHIGRANFPASCTKAGAYYPYRRLDETTAKSKLSATEGTFIVVLQNLPLRRWLSKYYATTGLLPLLRPFVVSSLGVSQPLLWRSTPLGYCLPVHLTGHVLTLMTCVAPLCPPNCSTLSVPPWPYCPRPHPHSYAPCQVLVHQLSVHCHVALTHTFSWVDKHHILHPFPLSSLRRPLLLLPRLTLMPMHSCHCLRVSLTLLYCFTLTLLCFFTLTLPLQSRSAMLHPLVLARAVSAWPQHGARQLSSCGSSVAT